MRILDDKYFSQYFDKAGNQIEKLIESFDFAEKNTDLEYKTQTSSVYSSNIEGNSIGSFKIRPHSSF